MIYAIISSVVAIVWYADRLVGFKLLDAVHKVVDLINEGWWSSDEGWVIFIGIAVAALTVAAVICALAMKRFKLPTKIVAVLTVAAYLLLIFGIQVSDTVLAGILLAVHVLFLAFIVVDFVKHKKMQAAE